jgi:glycosyltransferase involved in cell wall biosynthesis
MAAPQSAAVAEPVPSRPRKVLFSQMKNEAPFLLEWIAYHQVIGFDEIVICTNPSTDGTEEILEALATAGEVRHLRATVGPTEGALRIGSETFTREVGYRDGDWYMWMDGDEFLNVHAGDRTVDALIAAMAGRQIAPVSWRVFGTGGNSRFPGRFISGAFTGAAQPDFPSNLEVKTFFRYSQAVKGFGRYGINRPLLKRGGGLTPADVMVGNGGAAKADLRANERWLNGVDFGKSAWVDPAEFGWAHAQINHYVIRTPDFYMLKRMRGRGYTANSDTNGLQRYTDSFFQSHDRNEAEDRTILHWEAAVTDRIDRLMSIPAVANAAEASAAKVWDTLVGLGLREGARPPLRRPAPEQPVPETAEGTATPSFALTFPPEEAAYLRQAYAGARVILEYGSGGSTVLAARSGARVFAVESDRAWAKAMQAHLAPLSDRAVVHFANVGRTGDWGMPLVPRAAPRYHRYALTVWDRPDFEPPDLVLIDGRFRCACLLTVMLRASRPTTVLFDDYASRLYYHAVEGLAQKEEMIGRMARFTVTPGPIPPDMVTQAIGWFTDPR